VQCGINLAKFYNQGKFLGTGYFAIVSEPTIYFNTANSVPTKAALKRSIHALEKEDFAPSVPKAEDETTDLVAPEEASLSDAVSDKGAPLQSPIVLNADAVVFAGLLAVAISEPDPEHATHFRMPLHVLPSLPQNPVMSHISTIPLRVLKSHTRL
jgi:hypothetical protein